MRRLIFISIFFITVFYLSAQTTGSPAKEAPEKANIPVDFEITLKSLFQRVSEGNSHTIPTNKYIVIAGTVSDREVLDPDKENFLGILELSSGEWKGSTDISIYRCYVQLEGPKFIPMIPLRRSRKPDPLEIPLNSKVLVLGKYIGYSEDENGNKYPVITGIAVRKEQ